MLQVKIKVCCAETDPEPKLSGMDTESGLGRAEDEALGDPAGDEIVHRLIADELGGGIAELLRQGRRAQEARHRRSHPEEGLRERKRRITRQLISDAATTMFATRGFDNVKVSEVAERVGVSEKTVYNYFPTKEALVLDRADEAVEKVARALGERRPEESLPDAVVRALKADMADFDETPDELIAFVPRFAEMIDHTPALRAAMLELQNRVAKVARDELAAAADVDPNDPEPTIAGWALAGLAQVAFDSRVHHIRAGRRGAELAAVVAGDLERAARMLETGLWSFNLLARGVRAKQQAIDAAKAADEARAQVVKALRQARAAWRALGRSSRSP
jgi:AcrR family transcriptional regulator